ncbi:MAG: N-(5'-phosphoribosyl)anthranilate isomerase [Phaeodactylibacter sp.]|nr:N-(5'-phosphoribosyl)anthranilate isomerase [Phaeodactylibacter sp.]
MLKTKVKASSVTNLTDARYFAAWEVEWLGFNFGPGSDTYIQPQVMKAIKEWVDGVKIVGEFSLQPAEEILEAADMLELEAVQLGMFTDVETLRKLQAQEVPVLLEIIVESPEKLAGIYNRLKGEAPFVEAFLLNFDKNGIGWGALSEEHRQQLHTLCRDYRIILSMDFRAGTLEEALDLVQPYGINVRGGAEERVGFKSFDELDELFEALEIYE